MKNKTDLWRVFKAVIGFSFFLAGLEAVFSKNVISGVASVVIGWLFLYNVFDYENVSFHSLGRRNRDTRKQKEMRYFWRGTGIFIFSVLLLLWIHCFKSGGPGIGILVGLLGFGFSVVGLRFLWKATRYFQDYKDYEDKTQPLLPHREIESLYYQIQTYKSYKPHVAEAARKRMDELLQQLPPEEQERILSRLKNHNNYKVKEVAEQPPHLR